METEVPTTAVVLVATLVYSCSPFMLNEAFKGNSTHFIVNSLRGVFACLKGYLEDKLVQDNLGAQVTLNALHFGSSTF